MTIHAATPPDRDEDVTAMALCADAGITYRRLDLWSTAGMLRTVNRRHGYGHPRHYPASEVRIATIMRRLVDAGLDVTRAHDAARAHVPGQPVTLGAGLSLWIEDE
jgi:DNA-binding transcriptional MerR regulator